MSNQALAHVARRLPLLLLLLGVLTFPPEAAAQSRGRTGSGRVEQQGKKSESRSRARRSNPAPEKKATARSRSTRSQPSSRTPTTRSAPSRSTREAPSSRGRTESSARTSSRDRSRSGGTVRQRTPQRSGADVRSERPSTSPRSTPRASRSPSPRSTSRASRSPSPRSTPRASRSQDDRSRSTRGRAPSRDDRAPQARTQRSRTEDLRVGTGSTQARSGRSESSRGRQPRTQPDRDRQTSRPNADRSRSSAPSTRSARQPTRSSSRVERRTPGAVRRDDRSVRNRRVEYQPRQTWYRPYDRDHRYHKKSWNRRHARYRRPNVVFHPVVIRPRIHVDVYWPWVHRYRHGWRPRYQYRQVIYVDAGWGARYSQHRQAQIDVRTTYYHELRYADGDRAEVDIYVERIELYQNGRFVGEVAQIPDQLARIRATVYRDGRARFDRDVFILGDTYTGFELISTPYYDGFVLDHYQSSHGLRAGVVDLQRQRVVPTSYSRLFDPNNFTGYVPVSLVPENADWLFDYGESSFSAAYYDADPYYYGGYQGYQDYDDPYYGDDYYEEAYYEDDQGRPYFSVQSTVAEANFGITPVTQSYDRTYATDFGARIQLRRETSFVRVK